MGSLNSVWSKCDNIGNGVMREAISVRLSTNLPIELYIGHNTISRQETPKKVQCKEHCEACL
jgi:hypothetical protein